MLSSNSTRNSKYPRVVGVSDIVADLVDDFGQHLGNGLVITEIASLESHVDPILQLLTDSTVDLVLNLVELTDKPLGINQLFPVSIPPVSTIAEVEILVPLGLLDINPMSVFAVEVALIILLDDIQFFVALCLFVVHLRRHR